MADEQEQSTEVAETGPEPGSFEAAMMAAVGAGKGLSEAPEPFAMPEVPAEPEGAPVAPDAASEAAEAALDAAPPAPSAPEAPAEPDDKGMARLMQREQEIEDRLAQVAAREAKFQEAAPDLEDLRSRLDQFEAAQRQFAINPEGFIRSLAPDQDFKKLGETLWYAADGSKAPPQHQAQQAANQQIAALNDRLAKTEQGRAEEKRLAQEKADQQEAAQAQARYVGALEAYVKDTPAEKNPLVARLRDRNPDRIADHLWRVAFAHGQQTGNTLTPEQTAEALEKELEYFQLVAETPQAPAPPVEQGTSLRNTATQVQPDREPVDEMSDDYLRAKAFARIGLKPDGTPI